MGIFEKIKNATTGEVGTRYVDKNNKIVGEFRIGKFGGLTSELEILRGDLVKILYNVTKDNVRYIFDDFITCIDDSGEIVNVTFDSGKTESFDFIVGADGVGSAIRKMVFGNETKLDYLGLYTSYFTIAIGKTDTRWARWYIATQSRNILIRPDNKGKTRVSLNFLSPK